MIVRKCTLLYVFTGSSQKQGTVFIAKSEKGMDLYEQFLISAIAQIELVKSCCQSNRNLSLNIISDVRQL